MYTCMHFYTKTRTLKQSGRSNKKVCVDFSGGPVVKNPPANAGDMRSVPGQENPTCFGSTKPESHNY